MLSSLQCSSMAQTDGKKSTVHELLWNQENTCLRSLCKRNGNWTDIQLKYICILSIYLLLKFALQNGIAVLLLNLDNTTTVKVNPTFNNSSWKQDLHHSHHHHHHQHRSKTTRLPPKVHPIVTATREEYHLTAKDGNLHSRTMLLNGNSLTVDPSGRIPTLKPLNIVSSEPIIVAPYSIVFVHLPVVLPACR